MNKKYVIEYKYDGIDYDVIWKGEWVGDALSSFYNSYDAKEILKVSNVEIYSLVIFGGDTSLETIRELGE